MNMKLVSVVLTAAISIILIATVVTPVIEDVTTKDNVTYTNQDDPKYLFSLDTEGKAHTLEFTANGSTVTVDGNTRNITVVQFAIITDTWGISTSSNGLTMDIYTGQQFSRSLDKDVTVSMSNGSATIAYGTDTVTKEYSWALVFDPNGDYCQKKLTSGAYINDTDQVIVSEYSGSGYKACFDGVARISGVESTPNFTTSITEDTEDQIQRLTAMTIGELNVSYVFVPATVDYEPTANHAINSLLHVIPLFLLISVLVGIVSIITIRPRD